MEQNILVECLTKAVSESFEGIAFMEYDSYKIIDNLLHEQQPDYITSIEILQPYKGFVELFCQKDFILETTETLLGEEIPEGDEAVLTDTLGELINTVAGRFMAHLIPEDQDFSMGLPDTKKFNPEYADVNGKALILRFDFMDNIVFCRIGGEIVAS